jgi:hypothetical protein
MYSIRMTDEERFDSFPNMLGMFTNINSDGSVHVELRIDINYTRLVISTTLT